MEDEKIIIRVMIPSAREILVQVSTPALDLVFSEEWKLETALKAYLALQQYNIRPEVYFRGFFEAQGYEDRHTWTRCQGFYQEMVQLSERFIDHIHKVRPRLFRELGLDRFGIQIQVNPVSSPFSRFLVCDFAIHD